MRNHDVYHLDRVRRRLKREVHSDLAFRLNQSEKIPAAVVGVGICFWDLVNLVIIWLPALTLALPSPSTRDRIRRLAAAWPAWVAVIVPLVLYQWGYSMAKHGSPTSPGLSLFGRFVGSWRLEWSGTDSDGRPAQALVGGHDLEQAGRVFAIGAVRIGAPKVTPSA